MTTIGSQAVIDVCNNAMNVIAAFRNDPILEQLHPVQRKALEDLEVASRFLYEMTHRRVPGPNETIDLSAIEIRPEDVD